MYLGYSSETEGYLEQKLTTSQIVCQNIQHPHHLREYKDSVASLF